MTRYDPLLAPAPKAWFAIDEGERIALVRDYHRRQRIKVPNIEAHSVTHAAIENQIAEGIPSVTSALGRLMDEGLDRHEAVHAVGSVLVEHMANLMRGSRPVGDPSAPYFAALDNLTATSWRRSY